MSRCPGSPVKHRKSRGRGRPGNYKVGMRKHSYKKLVENGIHTGRTCTRCNKVFLNMRGIKDATRNRVENTGFKTT